MTRPVESWRTLLRSKPMSYDELARFVLADLAAYPMRNAFWDEDVRSLADLFRAIDTLNKEAP